MVEELERKQLVTSRAVRDAFLRVPREVFLPAHARAEGFEEIYKDRVFVTKKDAAGNPISSSSQPAIMAHMLEQLDLRPGMRVLEIGSGTGYNAAVLSSIVGPSGRVTTIEIDPSLARAARAALRGGRYSVRVVVGDGRRGWPAGAPYDRIIATASSMDVPRAWTRQLARDGLLEVPLRTTAHVAGVQLIPTFQKAGSGLRSVRLIPGGFMALRRRADDPAPGPPMAKLTLTVDGDEQYLGVITGEVLRTMSPGARLRLIARLAEPPRRRRISPADWGLDQFVALAADPHTVIAGGVADRLGRGLAVLRWRNGKVCGIQAWGGPAAEQALLRLVERWRESGRPSFDQLVVRVGYGAPPPGGHWRVVRRGSCVLTFDWEAWRTGKL